MSGLVVVGAGPVGLTAGLAALSRGTPVTVLEAEPSTRVRPGSRAIFVHQASLRTFERLRPGLGWQLAADGLVWSTRRTLWAGRQVYARTYGRRPAADLPPFTSLPQTLLEERLRRAYEEAGGRIVWNTPVTGVDPGPDGVRVRTADGGGTDASHVVAADGARSAVRRSLGIPLAGTTSGSDFVVVDVADAAHPLPPERVFHYRHPGVGGRNVLLVPFRGGWRVDLQCADEEEAADFAGDPDGWLADVLPGHEVTWVSRYRFHQRVAERLVDGRHRVLLAGEAAHLFPPFGARGMNSGIADAVAAVDAVADGDVGRYDRERRAAAWQNCRAAGAACAHLLARGRRDRLRQRGAALLAPFWEPAGRWLDSAPFGPPLRKVRY